MLVNHQNPNEWSIELSTNLWLNNISLPTINQTYISVSFENINSLIIARSVHFLKLLLLKNPFRSWSFSYSIGMIVLFYTHRCYANKTLYIYAQVLDKYTAEFRVGYSKLRKIYTPSTISCPSQIQSSNTQDGLAEVMCVDNAALHCIIHFNTIFEC